MFKYRAFQEARSPLIRRMSRHLNMATLHRMVDSAPERPMDRIPERFVQEEAPSPNKEVVKAFIWSHPVQEIEEGVITETTASDFPPKKKYAGSNQSPVTDFNVESQPSVQTTPENQRQHAEDDTMSDMEEQDGTWKRLQAIFSKHQEKGEDTQVEFDPDVEGKIPRQGKKSGATGIKVITNLYDSEKPGEVDHQRGLEEGDSLEEPPTNNDRSRIHIQTSHQRESSSDHITKQSNSEHTPPLETTNQESSEKINAAQEAEKIETKSPLSPSEESIIQTSQDAAILAKLPSPHTQKPKPPGISDIEAHKTSEALPEPQTKELFSPEMESRVADDLSGTVNDDELDTQTHPAEAQTPQSELRENLSNGLRESTFKDGQPASIQMDEGQFLPEKVESGKEEPPHPTGEILTTKSFEPAKKPPPLEDVWPVERKERRTSDTANEAAQISTSPHRSTGEIKSRSETDDPAYERIKDLPTKGPTQSSVEYLPPLHPRPLTPGGSSAQIQTKKIGDQDKPGLDMPALLQGQGSITHREDSIEPETIPTEIGPLPNDLWGLIDRTPPSQTADHQRMPGISSRTEAVIPHQKEISDSRYSEPMSPDDHPINKANTIAQRAVETRVATQSPSKPPISDEGFIQVPEIIQRQSKSAPETASAANDDSERSADNTPTGAQIDVDKLARQVYVEIKRRISIEWERMRGYK